MLLQIMLPVLSVLSIVIISKVIIGVVVIAFMSVFIERYVRYSRSKQKMTSFRGVG